MADTGLALAWLGKRHSEVCGWNAAGSDPPSTFGGWPPHMWKVGHSPAGGWELGRSGLGVVWGPPLGTAGQPGLFVVSTAAWNPIGQKPFLVLFLRLFG